MDVLGNSPSFCVTSDVFNPRRFRSIPRNRNLVECLLSNVNFTVHKTSPVTDDLDTESIVQQSSSWCGIRPLPRRKLDAWSGRRKNPLAIFVSFQSGLVCEENELDNSLRVAETEPNLQDLPNLDNHRTGAKLLIQELNLKVHFLEEKDEDTLARSILSLSRSNKVRSALELYLSVELSGLQPSLHACNSLLSCLLRNGYLKSAMKIFEKVKEKGMASSHTYSLILKAVASALGCDSALNLFWELEREETAKKSFDPIVYNTMISACGRANNWVQMEKLWGKLKEHHYNGTKVTYSILVCTFVRCGQSELALDAFQEMIQHKIKPGEDTMRAAIGACSKEGKWTVALDVLRHMLESGLRPNLIDYNALINCLGKAGEVDLAFKVYELMNSSSVEADVYTWKALLNALYKRARYADALQLFESIRRGNKFDRNHHLYNSVLMSCQKLRLWDQALQLLWEMEESGIVIPTVSYNHVIGSCEAARKPKIALQVYKHMVHVKCEPDIFTYLSLIRACAWESLWYEAEGILNSVTPPNASLYNTLIQGMCLRQQSMMARKLYKRMQDCGLKPDGKTRAFMLQQLSKDK
ncbi:pentatricopeptide repeat-containing protein At3g29290 [Aristolochia californica]|uniref:pentatricopeptide repeat-containing protein At3g29290 n=1 Tax=Aristolochia californica TaxID=171875 RepID=UPI0035DB052E